MQIVEGTWSHVILYEVPILSILSEAYFQHVDTAWDYSGQRALAKSKAETLLREGIAFSEFGTRRRRSYDAHMMVMQGLVDARNQLTGDGTLRGKLTGTSNVHFARLFGLSPVGTIAHEWIMGATACVRVSLVLRCAMLRHRCYGGIRGLECTCYEKMGNCVS